MQGIDGQNHQAEEGSAVCGGSRKARFVVELLPDAVYTHVLGVKKNAE